MHKLIHRPRYSQRGIYRGTVTLGLDKALLLGVRWASQYRVLVGNELYGAQLTEVIELHVCAGPLVLKIEWPRR